MGKDPKETFSGAAAGWLAIAVALCLALGGVGMGLLLPDMVGAALDWAATALGGLLIVVVLVVAVAAIIISMSRSK